jgi:hypothetical protein
VRFKYLGHIVPGKEPLEYLKHLSMEHGDLDVVQSKTKKYGGYLIYTCYKCKIKWS